MTREDYEESQASKIASKVAEIVFSIKALLGEPFSKLARIVSAMYFSYHKSLLNFYSANEEIFAKILSLKKAAVSTIKPLHACEIVYCVSSIVSSSSESLSVI